MRLRRRRAPAVQQTTTKLCDIVIMFSYFVKKYILFSELGYCIVSRIDAYRNILSTCKPLTNRRAQPLPAQNGRVGPEPGGHDRNGPAVPCGRPYRVQTGRQLALSSPCRSPRHCGRMLTALAEGHATTTQQPHHSTISVIPICDSHH